MELVEKMRGRVDKGEVFFIESTSRAIGFKGWKIRSSESTRECGYGVRVIVDGRVGTAATTDTAPDALQHMLDDAIAAAKFGEELDLKFPGEDTFPALEVYDASVRDVDIPALADAGKKLMGRLEKYKGDCDAELGSNASMLKIKLMNTEGFSGEYQKTRFGLSGALTRVKEGDIYMAWDFYSSTHIPPDINEAINPVVDKIDSVMQYAEKIVPAPKSGKIPIVFTPSGAFTVLLPLMQGINGNNIYTKTSPIFDKLEQKLFDEKLTIVDDGTIEKRTASVPFDAEGLPKQKLTLVENGVLKNFIFDLTTAHKSGYSSNGCASRSIFSPPQPSSSNIIVSPGDKSISSIIEGIPEGIMVESVLGLGQGNILSGAFSNPLATAFKIENGEVIGRVKNAAIAGNVYENLKEITAISSDTKWIYGVYSIPYIRLDNISVIGK
ncbi:hypothetical protein DRQ33_06020 [bacterium]|nr:MAG: hypothetical protein DRQ33_06020 [bacterium]